MLTETQFGTFEFTLHSNYTSVNVGQELTQTLFNMAKIYCGGVSDVGKIHKGKLLVFAISTWIVVGVSWEICFHDIVLIKSEIPRFIIIKAITKRVKENRDPMMLQTVSVQFRYFS